MANLAFNADGDGNSVAIRVDSSRNRSFPKPRWPARWRVSAVKKACTTRPDERRFRNVGFSQRRAESRRRTHDAIALVAVSRRSVGGHVGERFFGRRWRRAAPDLRRPPLSQWE